MIEIIIQNETFDFHSERPSTGVIYFKFDDLFFPEKDWNDFVDVILNWWLEGLIDILSNTKSQVDFVFMDGPFKLIALKKANDILSFRFGDNHFNINSFVFAENFSKEINSFLRYCSKNKLKNFEIEKIEKQYNLLQQKIKMRKDGNLSN